METTYRVKPVTKDGVTYPGGELIFDGTEQQAYDEARDMLKMHGGVYVSVEIREFKHIDTIVK